MKFTNRANSAITLQLTTSTRRSTDHGVFCEIYVRHFNSRPPHGGRQVMDNFVDCQYNFNSRPPHGGRHYGMRNLIQAKSTSTHDLHTEVDAFGWDGYNKVFGTSTHDLHTEVDYTRRVLSVSNCTSTHDLHTEVDNSAITKSVSLTKLQLTTSTRRSTRLRADNDTLRNTSTHDLHTEVDWSARAYDNGGADFNSRPPHGGRPSKPGNL